MLVFNYLGVHYDLGLIYTMFIEYKEEFIQ